MWRINQKTPMSSHPSYLFRSMRCTTSFTIIRQFALRRIVFGNKRLRSLTERFSLSFKLLAILERADTCPGKLH